MFDWFLRQHRINRAKKELTRMLREANTSEPAIKSIVSWYFRGEA